MVKNAYWNIIHPGELHTLKVILFLLHFRHGDDVLVLDAVYEAFNLVLSGLIKTIIRKKEIGWLVANWTLWNHDVHSFEVDIFQSQVFNDDFGSQSFLFIDADCPHADFLSDKILRGKLAFLRSINSVCKI